MDGELSLNVIEHLDGTVRWAVLENTERAVMAVSLFDYRAIQVKFCYSTGLFLLQEDTFLTHRGLLVG